MSPGGAVTKIGLENVPNGTRCGAAFAPDAMDRLRTAAAASARATPT
jgi:hypothetical protein